MALNLSDYGVYFGIACIVFGSIFLITGVALTITKGWMGRRPADDEDILTN